MIFIQSAADLAPAQSYIAHSDASVSGAPRPSASIAIHVSCTMLPIHKNAGHPFFQRPNAHLTVCAPFGQLCFNSLP
jgi:hypothetical protein